MRMRNLGKTGIKVSELCLGTGTFGGLGPYKLSGEVKQKEADIIVGTALNAGINFFDTAEVYSDGLSEIILGKALGAKRKEAIIVSKICPKRPTETSKGGLTREHIIERCEASIKRLNSDYIDIYELHIFDPTTPLEETLQAMDDLVRQGKVRYIGCSNFSGWQMMNALSIIDAHKWAKFVTLEAKYSLLLRELENELVPLCLDQGVDIIVFSPLHGGFLSGKYAKDKPWPAGTRFISRENVGAWPVDFDLLDKVVGELENISKERGVSVSSVALNYLLRKPAICSTIIGIRTVKQLEDNLTATDWELTPDDIAKLDMISKPADLYPYVDQKSNFLFS